MVAMLGRAEGLADDRNATLGEFIEDLRATQGDEELREGHERIPGQLEHLVDLLQVVIEAAHLGCLPPETREEPSGAACGGQNLVL